MKLISQQKALNRLEKLKSDFKSEISNSYEHRAKSCLTCEMQGACCLDAHFVNVHISRLESVAIRQTLDKLPDAQRRDIYDRIDSTIREYNLSGDGDTYAQTYACPLFEKGTGCLVHKTGKPLPCITHACYENAADLPPDELLSAQEKFVGALDKQTYGHPQPWLPLPLALLKGRFTQVALTFISS